MRQLIWKQLRFRKGAAILFILAFFLIFTITPLAISSLQTVISKVETDVSYYARGSYDLLVRPQGAEQDIEREKGIVPENYLGFGNGGISISEWENLKNREDIEIAAPVASLGYFTGVKSNVGFPLPDRSTRYQVRYQTTDGINHYQISDDCSLLSLFFHSSQSSSTSFPFLITQLS
ncbi:hypothetical protein J9303_16385 [Bacillaceae bacterium Marseille-Q3522]|nr:hypothetical protein [Bacillaceae bacterium Marseille-Q3522]